MKDFVFGTSSKAEIATVHPDLQKVCVKALELAPVDFRVLQGIRTFDEQLKAFKGGFSKIDPRKSKGRHMVGCAIDFVVFDRLTGKITFEDVGRFRLVREAFHAAAKALNIPIRTLESIGDLGHVELLKAKYPDDWKK